jgi:hypothetical protein
MSKAFYTVGKALSNFAVLALMVLILGAAAVAIQVAAHRHGPFQLLMLLSPILFFGLSAVSITAALAVLFESLPVLRGGVGNVIYFFLWVALISLGAASLGNGVATGRTAVFEDFTGVSTVMGQMQNQVRALDSSYRGGGSFSVGGLTKATKTFLWEGLDWNPMILASRALQAGIALLLALLAAVFFDRFDPARASAGATVKKQWSKRRGQSQIGDAQPVAKTSPNRLSTMSAAQLSAVPRGSVRLRIAGLVIAELRLMLKGQRWWWYAVAAGLWIGCAASPMETARSGVLTVAWIWPTLIWSQMGARETQRSVGLLVFSAPRAVPRQLLAVYGAGVIVAMATGSGVAVRLAAAGDSAGLAAWLAGAMFVPALALALGVTTGSRKAFEALYTIWWYAGPLHHIRGIDFMGTTPQSSTPAAFAIAALLLVVMAYVARQARVVYA